MSSPCPSWPSPVSRTTIESLVNPPEVSRVNGSSSQRSIRRGNSATREYVISVPLTAGWPSPGGTAISGSRRDTEPQADVSSWDAPHSLLLALPRGDQARAAVDCRHRRLHGVHAVPPHHPRARGGSHEAPAQEGGRCGRRLRPDRDRRRRRL